MSKLTAALLADAAFEAALAVALLVLTLSGSGMTMAAPAYRPVIVAIAILLLIVAAILLLLSARPSERLVTVVALANATSAFIIAFWLVAGWGQFSTSGRIITAATVAGLVALAVAELLATMEPSPART